MTAASATVDSARSTREAPRPSATRIVRLVAQGTGLPVPRLRRSPVARADVRAAVHVAARAAEITSHGLVD